jgi:hypothetical protein
VKPQKTNEFRKKPSFFEFLARLMAQPTVIGENPTKKMESPFIGGDQKRVGLVSLFVVAETTKEISQLRSGWNPSRAIYPS